MTSVIVTTMFAHYVLSGNFGKDVSRWLANKNAKKNKEKGNMPK